MVCLQIVRIETVEGWSVGREQISQMVCSGSLVPCLVHNGCVTNGDRLYHCACTWWGTTCSQATLLCRDMWAPPRKWRRYCIMTVSTELVRTQRRGKETVGLRMWLPCSRERIILSALPTAPGAPCGPLVHVLLTWVQQGCAQQGSWHWEQDQWHSGDLSKTYIKSSIYTLNTLQVSCQL